MLRPSSYVINREVYACAAAADHVRPAGIALARCLVVALLLWLLLLVFCWPLALLALVLYPLVWLLSLPFRLVGLTVEGVFALLRALILLPARVLGGRVR
jgi:hypothetical protein